MVIWHSELKELEKLQVSLAGHFPGLERETSQLLKTEDENVVMLYSRRCLEVIITDLCECELRRPRKTEPLKGIIDKLNKDEKVPSFIITSMHSLNSMSTYGTHPKDFDPDQVRPVLTNLAIILKWYLKYKGIELVTKQVDIDGGPLVEKRMVTDVGMIEKSVAVLPFRNDSKDEENTYFINGLMEEILNNLQKIKDLRVISRTSVEQYRNQVKPIPEIAKELGVNYIVEGSGQKYGNAFRLRTQLIIAARETHLWGESYQKKVNDIEDIFSVQTQIAEAIASELKAELTATEKKLIKKVPTDKLEAYDYYLKGQFYWRKLTEKDFDISLKYYELARETDPNFALAYAGICEVWLGRQQLGFTSPDVAGPLAYEAAMKALELDNTSAEVNYTLAIMYTWGMFDYSAGESYFRTAIELKPAFPEAHIYFAHLLFILRKFDEARIHADLALKLDPANPLVVALYAVCHLSFHEYDKVIRMANEALEMDPLSGLAYFAIAYANMYLGRNQEMTEAFVKIFSIQYRALIETVDFSSLNGDYNKKLQILVESAINNRSKIYVLPSDIVQVYVALGDKEKAIEWCRTGIEEHDPGIPYAALILEKFGDDPQVREILLKANLPY